MIAMHEILAQALPYLWHPNSPVTQANRICLALTLAYTRGALTIEECDAGCDRVVETIVEQSNGRCMLLYDLALQQEAVAYKTSLRDPTFIKYRDEWLRNLIAIERAKHAQQA